MKQNSLSLLMIRRAIASKRKIEQWILFVVILFSSSNIKAQTPVTYTAGPSNAQINAVFGGFSNVTISGGTLNAGVRGQQIAIFQGGLAAGLEIDEGLFLGTGKVAGLLKKNSNYSNPTDYSLDDLMHSDFITGTTTYSDPDLIGLEPRAQYDAVSYSMNVKVGNKATKMSITYQFGSEEYPNFVGSKFNDVFGFFVSGPGITGTKNLAKLPNGNDTKVNKVNYGSLGSAAESPYYGFDSSQSSLYIKNGHSTQMVNGKIVTNENPGPFPVAVQFNGLTKAITFEISNLTPGATYTFKLAIADVVDGAVDAGVFIKKNSIVAMADIKANTDTFTLACNTFTTNSVLANDTYNSSAATTTDVQLSPVSFPNGFTLNSNGSISVASTVAAGTYNLTYSICDKTFLTNCSTATVTVTIINRLDSDGDGVSDECDLDDDNDGILDAVECPKTFRARPALLSSASKLADVGSMTQILDGEGFSGTINSTETPFPGAGPYPYFYWNQSKNPVTFFINMKAASRISVMKFYPPWGYDEGIKNATIRFYNGTTLLGTENILLPDGSLLPAGIQTIPLSQTYNNVTNVQFVVVEAYTSNSTPPRTSLTEIVFGDFNDCKDIDGDGIPDYLDLDSDNDGCPDAIEGGKSFTTTDMVNSSMSGGNTGATSGSYNQPVIQNLGNTVGSIASTMGVPTIAGTGQTIGDSQNAAVTQCATPTPFTCDTNYYLTQYQSSGGPTTLYSLNNSTQPFTITPIGVSPANYQVNGIGYNSIDNFIYGMRTDGTNNNHIVKIGSNGVMIDLGVVSSLPTGGYNSGTFDNAGNYYILNYNSNKLYKVNISTLLATPITLNRILKTSDFIYDITTNLLYVFDIDFGGLATINPVTSAVTNVGVSDPAFVGKFMGAMFTDSNGDIYGNEDDGLGFFQFNKSTGQKTLISTSISAYGNDGANCPTAIMTFSADLSVTKTDGKTTYIPGTTNTYTVVVKNNGPYGVVNASVVDNMPTGIPATNVSYTAVASTGSSTTVIGTQTGAINDMVSLPNGGSITYTINIAIPASYTVDLVNIVTVTPPANSIDPTPANNSATDIDTNSVCYKPAATDGNTYPTQHGITALSRAGVESGNWPMVRQSAWTVLEAKTKGFVINRIATTALVDAIANPVEGMMVFDIQADCLKINTNGTATGWKCFNIQTCP